MSTQVIRYPRPGSDKVWFRFSAKEHPYADWKVKGDGIILESTSPSNLGPTIVVRLIRREDFFSAEFSEGRYAPFLVKDIAEAQAAATAAYQEALKLDEQAKADLVCDELQDVLSNDVVKRKLVERGLRITALEAELAESKRKIQELRYLQPLAQWAAKVKVYLDDLTTGCIVDAQIQFPRAKQLQAEYREVVAAMKKDGHEVKL